MDAQRNEYIANYLEFTFNGGSPIVFDNNEILGEVEYVPAFIPEIKHSESGLAFSIKKPQPEYFKFKLKLNYIDSRRRLNEIHKALKNPYTLVFKCYRFVSPFLNLPPVDSTSELGDNTVVTFTISNAIVELPDDTSFDRIGRGLGSRVIDDIEIKVYRGGTFAVPTDPCTALQAASVESNFSLYPWELDGSNNLLRIRVEREPGGTIASIGGWPGGSVFREGVLMDNMNPSYMIGSAQVYEPENIPPPTIDGATWTFRIPNIPVTLTTGETCTVTFEQTYGTPPADYNNDYSSDYN